MESPRDFRFWIGRSSDHSICSSQDIRRNCYSDLLGGLEIDDELVLGRWVYGKIEGLTSLHCERDWRPQKTGAWVETNA